MQIVSHRASMNSAYTPGTLTIRLRSDGYTIEAATPGIKIAEDEKEPQPKRIEGPLLDYVETGTEGTAGDDLTIRDGLGATLWAGVILCEKRVGWWRYPMNPKTGQQCALGCWFHWIQEGFQPDEWAKFFIRPDYDRLHGVLRRKRGRRNP